MAESRQFGGPKIRQFGDRTAGNQPGDSGHCAQCEGMLADALDGTLSAADQTLFDAHMAECGPCGQLLADARRGHAWLEMLRDPKPAPPASLVERILAQTSGAAGQMTPVPMPLAGVAAQSAHAAGVQSSGQAPAYINVLPFPRRVAASMRRSSFGQILLQPRLAMTAAMAFFSIALTLNLTGIRLQDLRASDLKPSSLKRDFYSANARVVQYYEGLRVVYELESRVHDLQSASDNDATVGSQAAPASKAAPDRSDPNGSNPDSHAQPDSSKPAPGDQPDQKQRPASGPHSGTGAGPGSRQPPNSPTSRRDLPGGTLSVAALDAGDLLDNLLAGPLASANSDETLEGRLV